MNLDTVLMCAQMAAAKQLSGLGFVDPAIQELIDELTIPVEQVPLAVQEEAPVEQVPEETAEQPSEA